MSQLGEPEKAMHKHTGIGNEFDSGASGRFLAVGGREKGWGRGNGLVVDVRRELLGV